jgi:hypothetical protein
LTGDLTVGDTLGSEQQRTSLPDLPMRQRLGPGYRHQRRPLLGRHHQRIGSSNHPKILDQTTNSATNH